MVDLCQSEPSCFWNDTPGPDGGEEADEGEGEEGGRDAQHQAEVWHHLGGHYQCIYLVQRWFKWDQSIVNLGEMSSIMQRFGITLVANVNVWGGSYWQWDVLRYSSQSLISSSKVPSQKYWRRKTKSARKHILGANTHFLTLNVRPWPQWRTGEEPGRWSWSRGQSGGPLDTTVR